MTSVWIAAPASSAAPSPGWSTPAWPSRAASAACRSARRCGWSLVAPACWRSRAASAALLIAAGDALVRRTRHPRALGGRWSGRRAAPLIVYDAFALFAGHAAGAHPGHRLISVALIVAGLLAVALAVWLYARLAGAPRALAARGATALVVAAIGADAREPLGAAAALRLVPRDAVGGDAGGARARGAPAGARGRARVAAGAGGDGRACRLRGRDARAAHQPGDALCGARADGAGGAGAARGAGVVAVAQPIAAAERRAAEVALPPLPDGPRRPEADVLLITIDALRADHVGAYGYARADHAQHRRAGRARRALHARLRAGAAHVVLDRVDDDGQVLPDAGPPGARRAPRPDRGGAAHATAGGRRRSIRRRCSSSTRRS